MLCPERKEGTNPVRRYRYPAHMRCRANMNRRWHRRTMGDGEYLTHLGFVRFLIGRLQHFAKWSHLILPRAHQFGRHRGEARLLRSGFRGELQEVAIQGSSLRDRWNGQQQVNENERIEGEATSCPGTLNRGSFNTRFRRPSSAIGRCARNSVIGPPEATRAEGERMLEV